MPESEHLVHTFLPFQSFSRDRALQLIAVTIGFAAVLMQHCVATAQAPTQDEARSALHRAVRFFRNECSVNGGYVYRHSADLKKQEGEGKVGKTTAWIQPPGTPHVGLTYLRAYQLTGEPVLKQALLQTTEALVRGQLESGGWGNNIEFDPQKRREHAYRVDFPDRLDRRRNQTTFDDNKSQSALRCLMLVDQELNFENQRIHEAATYGLEAFLKAQYPNGAWPQRYSEFPDPDAFPVRKARLPETWSREFPGQSYAGYYTLNDNTIRDLIVLMLDAWSIYDDERFLESAKSGGDFFLIAQLPEPQPGWAQQYNFEMEPAWARKFEPPAVTGGESQGVLDTLLLLYERTGEAKYLAPLPRALEYYRDNLLDDGRLARFYELRTNRPLYFTKEYELTYSDADMPTHYGFQTGSRLEQIAGRFEKFRATPWQQQAPLQTPPRPSRSTALIRRAHRAIETLDQRGAWVEEGQLRYHGDDDDTRQIIETRTFCDNLTTLAQFLAADDQN